MLDLRQIRAEPQRIAAALARRGGEVSLDPLLQADARRRELLVETETLRARRNAVSEDIARRKRAGEDAADAVAEMRAVGDRIKELEVVLKETEAELEARLLELPNLPDPSVPDGRTEADNVIVRTWGEPPKFDFPPRPHWEIGVDLGILDFARATKIAGARFEVLRGSGARLRRALIDWMLDVHTREQGYVEIFPPIPVKRESLIASGHLPKFEADQFKLREADLYLSPTSEAQLVNLHRDEVLDGDRLPLCYTAYTPCFRHEKFSAGKESRGLTRQYQFDKVEMFKFVRPEDSAEELEKLVSDAEELYRRLGLPYQLALLCTGDLGQAAAKTFDPMAWFPGLDEWIELSSCSNCLDYQARRASIRFRRSQGAKPEFVHTLNGSGLAVGRTLAAVLENYQQADGTVRVPDVLVPYMGGLTVITKTD